MRDGIANVLAERNSVLRGLTAYQTVENRNNCSPFHKSIIQVDAKCCVVFADVMVMTQFNRLYQSMKSILLYQEVSVILTEEGEGFD